MCQLLAQLAGFLDGVLEVGTKHADRRSLLLEFFLSFLQRFANLGKLRVSFIEACFDFFISRLSDPYVGLERANPVVTRIGIASFPLAADIAAKLRHDPARHKCRYSRERQCFGKLREHCEIRRKSVQCLDYALSHYRTGRGSHSCARRRSRRYLRRSLIALFR